MSTTVIFTLSVQCVWCLKVFNFDDYYNYFIATTVSMPCDFPCLGISLDLDSLYMAMSKPNKDRTEQNRLYITRRKYWQRI